MDRQDGTEAAAWVRRAPAEVRGVLSAVQFLPWFAISALDHGPLPPEIRNALRRSGNYVVAISDDTPPDDPLIREVHYIGMTKGERTSLARRVAAFATAARGGEASHNGGRTWWREKLGDAFWIRVAPSIDLRSVEWSAQGWTIWPDLVEKALLMAYAHRHSAFPTANQEGWAFPKTTLETIDAVDRLVTASGASVAAASREALLAILSAWGYERRRVDDDPGHNEPGWIGAEASLSRRYWLWVGRSPVAACHIGIWSRDGAAWSTVEVSRREEIESALMRLSHSWHASAGLVG